MAMIAIAGDHAVTIRIQRGLQPDGDRFLSDIKMAEPANQPEPVKLPRLFLEPPDQQQLTVEIEHFLVALSITLVLFESVLKRVEEKVGIIK